MKHLDKQALNRLYDLEAINNSHEQREDNKKMEIYKVKETIFCDGLRKKSTGIYSHKKFLNYIHHLDEMTNRGIIHYTLKRRNFDVQVKIYM